MNSALLLRRLKKWRTDRALTWAKPAHNHYSVIVWRRINPRYRVEGAAFDGTDNYQFVEIHYARWRWLAIIYQGFLGRSKWSDGFRQQRIEIFPPNYGRVIFRDVLAPGDGFFDFVGYPNADGRYDAAVIDDDLGPIEPRDLINERDLK